jgi:hypothetical protein
MRCTENSGTLRPLARDTSCIIIPIQPSIVCEAALVFGKRFLFGLARDQIAPIFIVGIDLIGKNQGTSRGAHIKYARRSVGPKLSEAERECTWHAGQWTICGINFVATAHSRLGTITGSQVNPKNMVDELHRQSPDTLCIHDIVTT